MNVIFDWLANTDTTREDRRKKLQQEMNEVQKKIDQYDSNYAVNMEQRDAKINEIYEDRKKIIEERIEELIYIDKRYKELKKRRERINRLAAQYVVLVLFNYSCGYSLIDEEDFVNKFKTTYNVIFPQSEPDIRKDVFKLLSKISVLLPLIWPTGEGDSEIHQKYEIANDGTPKTVQHQIEVNSYISDYTRNNLRRYTFNVCVANCWEFVYNLRDTKALLKEQDIRNDEYIESLANCLTDDSFIVATYKFLKQYNTINDIMRLKLLSAKSRKGISKYQVQLLPLYYPKNCPEYELYEALLMIVNTICYHYGSIRRNGSLILTDSLNIPSDAALGGMCFEIPEEYIKNCYKEYFDLDPNDIWDLNQYCIVSKLHQINIKPELITGSSNKEFWMKRNKLHDEVYLNNIGVDGKGILKYVNPTRRYTFPLLKDSEFPDEKFTLPRLSANMSELFKNELLYNLWMMLTENKDYVSYSSYLTTNSAMFNSFDYIACIPETLKMVHRVSPTCQFVYDKVLVESLKWFLIFPIDNTMTMTKINTNIIKALGTNAPNFDGHEPQYIWAGNETELKERKTTSEVKNDKLKMYSVQPLKRSMDFKNSVSYTTWISSDCDFIYNSEPAKDSCNLFDITNEYKGNCKCTSAQESLTQDFINTQKQRKAEAQQIQQTNQPQSLTNIFKLKAPSCAIM